MFQKGLDDPPAYDQNMIGFVNYLQSLHVFFWNSFYQLSKKFQERNKIKALPCFCRKKRKQSLLGKLAAMPGRLIEFDILRNIRKPPDYEPFKVYKLEGFQWGKLRI